MRLQHLLPLAASLALALPFGAQAGEWPTGAKEQYMTQCQAAAAKQVDAKTAAQHCGCGAKVIEAKYLRLIPVFFQIIFGPPAPVK